MYGKKCKIRHPNDQGFSLTEVLLAIGLTAVVSLSFGSYFADQIKTEVSIRSKAELSSEYMHIAHKLNSVDWVRRQFEEFKTQISNTHGAAVLTEFELCTTTRANADCLKFANEAIYPPVQFSEVIPVNRYADLQVNWKSAIDCAANTCASFAMLATNALNPTSGNANDFNYYQLLVQRKKMTASPQKIYPVNLLIPVKDISYTCASDPNNGLIQGLDPETMQAKCGVMQGSNSCTGLGSRPMAQFGSDAPSCQVLVAASCSHGLSNGGFFDGTCSPTKSQVSLNTFAKVDANGNVVEYTVCGPSGGGTKCMIFAIDEQTGVTPEEFEATLANNPGYDQLISTWQNEGLLLDGAINKDFYGSLLNPDGTPAGFEASTVDRTAIQNDINHNVYVDVSDTKPADKFVDPATSGINFTN